MSDRRDRCGFCDVMRSAVRRAMCIRSRRGSTESCYKELEDPEENLRFTGPVREDSYDLLQEILGMSESGRAAPHVWPGRFLTMRRQRRSFDKKSTKAEKEALLDGLQVGQVQCILHHCVSWNFNAFYLETVSGGRSLMVLCVHLFHIYGLITYFDLDVIRVWKLFSLIEGGYRNTNPYHNSIHAADVTQAMHAFLQEKEILPYLTPIEIMAALLAAMTHDMDHPGVSQPFLIATADHLAVLYDNQSVLENHHWRIAVSCLMQSRLFEGMDISEEVEKQISSLILATDITRQLVYLNKFEALMDTKTLDMTKKEHRHLVLQIALKCADISNPCRQWEISRKWSRKVCEEFFLQGDYERKLNLPITALCDRYTTSIPKIQTGFFKYIVTPLMSQWHRFLHSDLSSEMMKNLLFNQEKWDAQVEEELAKERKKKIIEDLKNSFGINISDSSELLLPRRGSLNIVKPNKYKKLLRRFSVPLDLFQDTKPKYKEERRSSLSAEMRIKAFANFIGDQQALHAELEDKRETNEDAQKASSTENLVSDDSAPVVANRQVTIVKDGVVWKLVRRQTFPITASIAHTDGQLCRLKSTSSGGIARGETDFEKLAKETRVRREAAIVGERLRDNLFAMQNSCSHRQLYRTKSMMSYPTYIERERKIRQLALVMPDLLRCALTGEEFWPRRRRSDPAPVASSADNSLRNLASPEILNRSISGTGRSNILTCEQWFAQEYAAQEIPPPMPRRHSLPVEVYPLTKEMDYAYYEY